MESHKLAENLIPTVGEVLPDGSFIELVRVGNRARPELLLRHGQDQVIGRLIEHNGMRYQVRSIPESILGALRLPGGVGSFGTERELLCEMSRLIDKFVGLPPKFSSLIGRIILATWVVEALETAPALLIEGPDLERANALFRLLHCLCRRALPLGAVTAASICTLPSGMCFSLLVRQSTFSSRLSNLLKAATKRGTPMLRGGELRDFFGAQVLFCEASSGDGITSPSGTLSVPCVPSAVQLAVLDRETQQKIADEFQPKLLAFRFSCHASARASRFDSSKFALPLRELANSLAAATPGDQELQAELLSLLEDENKELKSANWIDLNTVVVESMLVHCREAKRAAVYVGEIAEMAEVILKGRGDVRNIDAGDVGRRIKRLGFATEPRDARGIKLRLTNEFCVRVQLLAEQFDVPGAHAVECRM